MSEGTAASATGPGQAQARTVHYLRPGLTSITPHVVVRGGAQFIAFLKAAFEGTERLRMPTPDGSIMHAEVAIGNGTIELSDGSEAYPAAPCAIHLYVDDADATYARAVQAGATSVYSVKDQPWGDRQGAVKDQFGNHWYIAKPIAWTPGPEGLRSVQPFLHLREAHKMVPFLEAAFGAEALGWPSRRRASCCTARCASGTQPWRLTRHTGNSSRCHATCMCTCRTPMRCTRRR